MKQVILFLFLLNFGCIFAQKSASIATTATILAPRISSPNQHNEITLNESNKSVEVNFSAVEISVNNQDLGTISEETSLITLRTNSPATTFSITFPSMFSVKNGNKMFFFGGITGNWQYNSTDFQVFQVKFDKVEVEEYLVDRPKNPLAVTLHYN